RKFHDFLLNLMAVTLQRGKTACPLQRFVTRRWSAGAVVPTLGRGNERMEMCNSTILFRGLAQNVSNGVTNPVAPVSNTLARFVQFVLHYALSAAA
ncbi:MAG: hypothetical protein WCL08_11540, partial [Verrucomicrobiota bacterium]